MIEILLEDSFAEWFVPLTILIIWIFSLVIIRVIEMTRDLTLVIFTRANKSSSYEYNKL